MTPYTSTTDTDVETITIGTDTLFLSDRMERLLTFGKLSVHMGPRQYTNECTYKAYFETNLKGNEITIKFYDTSLTGLIKQIEIFIEENEIKNYKI